MFETCNNIIPLIRDIAVKNRYVFVTFLHLIQAALANYLAFALRFESIYLSDYLKQLLLYLPILLVIRLVFYFQAGLYKNHLRFSGVHDLIKIIKSIILGSITFSIVIRYLIGDTSYPISIYIFDLLLLLIISGGGRLSLRVAYEKYLSLHPSGKRMLIVGTSGISEKIIRDMKNNPQYGYNPVGIIDEDSYKKGLTIHGVPIFGPIKMIPEIIKKHNPDEILLHIAVPGSEAVREVFELSKLFNIPIKKLPNFNDILDYDITEPTKIGQRLITANLVTQGQIREALSLQKAKGEKLGSSLVKLGYLTEDNLVSFLIKYNGISSMKSLALEDLLQREPVNNDIESVRSFIEGKTVLVTGAGGSIGSELCRQILKYNPGNLILFDRHLSNLCEIDNELKSNNCNKTQHLENNITSVIGDILDTSKLEYLFSKYKPHIVFHAAAHKHVPLMENNPLEAVKNNIFGTKNVIDISARHCIKNFIMISTDKAVNPTSIMGATKRVAEFLTTGKNASSSTRFTIVRFGNVLGSNGSVVNVFKKLIKKGGPLTVTHPDMQRYFMLIPEAIQLVLTAAAAGKDGEIFVLDMGKQIKIVDLAENLIRLSGFIPNKEIKIVFTGLRQGEKLYEELFDESEKVVPAFSHKLRIAISSQPSKELLYGTISRLRLVVKNNCVEEVVPTIQKLVRNFKSDYGQVPENISKIYVK